jgi:dienelactone hydrolase
LFSFSAGGVYLSKVLRERPSYVRSIVAYYSALDLNEFKELLGDKLSAEQLQKQSPAAQLDTGNTALMPMLIVKAARDREDINRSIDRFVAKAHQHNANIEMLVHPQGQHGFDVLDDDAHTRTIIKRTLEFMQTTLEQRFKA